MERRWIFLVLVLLLTITGCTKEEPKNNTINISAAISLTDALEEIQSLYEKERDVSLSFNLAGSGTLAQQIQQGAPVDIFISANEDWMNALEKEELIEDGTRETIVKNELVLIAHKESKINEQSFKDIQLKNFSTIAIGNPETVPAGKYAIEALSNIGIKEELEEQFVFSKDVRQVLTYVETGNADIGFVYKSDALQGKNIKIISTIDKDLYDAIHYPGAVIRGSKRKDDAQDFLQFLVKEDAQEIFKKYGFLK